MKPAQPLRRKSQKRQSLIPAIACVAALLLLASGYLWLIGGGASPPAQAVEIGGPFKLVQDNGRTVTDRDFLGKYLLIYFGYTSCPDVCPTALASMAEALDRLGAKSERVQPLFITVDPARDTPAVVRQFVSAFTPKLVGLTGSPEDIRAVTNEYRIISSVHSGSPGYAVDHSSVIYLVGPDGRYIAPVRADITGTDLANAIGGYLPSRP